MLTRAPRVRPTGRRVISRGGLQKQLPRIFSPSLGKAAFSRARHSLEKRKSNLSGKFIYRAPERAKLSVTILLLMACFKRKYFSCFSGRRRRKGVGGCALHAWKGSGAVSLLLTQTRTERFHFSRGEGTPIVARYMYASHAQIRKEGLAG